MPGALGRDLAAVVPFIQAMAGVDLRREGREGGQIEGGMEALDEAIKAGERGQQEGARILDVVADGRRLELWYE